MYRYTIKKTEIIKKKRIAVLPVMSYYVDRMLFNSANPEICYHCRVFWDPDYIEYDSYYCLQKFKRFFNNGPSFRNYLLEKTGCERYGDKSRAFEEWNCMKDIWYDH